MQSHRSLLLSPFIHSRIPHFPVSGADSPPRAPRIPTRPLEEPIEAHSLLLRPDQQHSPIHTPGSPPSGFRAVGGVELGSWDGRISPWSRSIGLPATTGGRAPLSPIAHNIPLPASLDQADRRSPLVTAGEFRLTDHFNVQSCGALSPIGFGSPMSPRRSPAGRSTLGVGHYDRALTLMDLTRRITKGPSDHPYAHGGFASVYKCRLRTRNGFTEAAVKAIRYSHQDDERTMKRKGEKLVRELKVWHALSHRNILPLYGVSHGFGPMVSMVCPWVEGGTLMSYLDANRDLDENRRLALVHDVAAGLNYLHSKQIVHGDISGSNVLILPSGEACLSDFGLSIVITDMLGHSGSSSQHNGTLRWSDPELWFPSGEGEDHRPRRSARSDIYSFGSVMFQTLSGRMPYVRYSDTVGIILAMQRGEKPARRAEYTYIAEVQWDFMERCWAAVRPTAQDAEEFVFGELPQAEARRMSLTKGTGIYQQWIDLIWGSADTP
ncbi:hypothetical protein HYDPIDRAFT_34660 [Hydnomerulius pinastri MD-312]|uniref:Protein kinase domain-containing protein n=1 Tax=Hydnomerulius pinastri MD-312 TaxID=994086 RepID=A0A0C9VKB3_9AGAM|nr:hypothetical protein HYDPIDRAFT_34660 [Hydnomerulius pinastri MD-312]